MRNKGMINRLQGYLDQGKDRVQSLADDLEDRFNDDLIPLAKTGLKRGRKQMISAEELLADTMREHQLTFVLIGIGLFALIVGSIFASTRSSRDW